MWVSLYHGGHFPVLQVRVGRLPFAVLDTVLSACRNLRCFPGNFQASSAIVMSSENFIHCTTC